MNLYFHAGIATSMSNSFFALFLFSFNFITPRLLGPPLHIHGYLYLTAVFNFMGAVLVLLGIPETKVKQDNKNTFLM